MQLWIFLVIGYANAIDINEFYKSFDDRMHHDERKYLKEKTKEMLLHSYESYKKICGHTCDVITPITCKPVYHSSGLVGSNEFYGNFSLTLIEMADTLAIMGLYDEFYDSIDTIIKHTTFDKDIIVSAFEINIRVLGGLLSSHSLIHEIKPKYPKFKSYNNELLKMAVEVGDRLMIAFTHSPQGIPYRRLYWGRSLPLVSEHGTSVADAGSYILEFCTLSHMTGDNKYCQAALTALDKIWDLRNSKYDLPFTFLNMKSLSWTDSTFNIGAGSDSYFEYLMKGYVMTGNQTLFHRFHIHYNAIEKYLKYNLTYAHAQLSNSLHFKSVTDIFQAFWPSIQVMYGDFENGLKFYYYLFKILSTYVFIPESISLSSMKSVDSSFNLRPEFIESTYHLYRATKDPFYLNVGKFVLYSTENYCRSKCGYSSLQSIFGTKLDRTETFFSSEYLKYLYLLFSVDDADTDLPIDLDNYVFNTEAHFMPIIKENIYKNDQNMDYTKPPRLCQLNPFFLDPDNIKKHRNEILNTLENNTHITHNFFNDFQFYLFDDKNQQQQNKYLTDNDIAYFNDKNNQIFTINYDVNIAGNNSLINNKDLTKYELLHKLLNYKSKKSDMEKPVFIKLPSLSSSSSSNGGGEFIVQVGVGFFGRSVNKNFETMNAPLSKAKPFDACSELTNRDEISGKIVIAIRGTCNFLVKARYIQKAGGIAAFILNNHPSNDVIIHMISDQYHNDILIPALFLSLLDPKNKDIFDLHKSIVSLNNKQLNSMKSTIFSTSFSINIVIN